MKEQKTASEYIETVYGASRFTRTLAVGDTQSIVDLMQDFSDQQNAELRERVKELEGALKQCRNAIDSGERIEKGQTVYHQVFGKAFLDMINNALK